MQLGIMTYNWSHGPNLIHFIGIAYSTMSVVLLEPIMKGVANLLWFTCY